MPFLSKSCSPQDQRLYYESVRLCRHLCSPLTAGRPLVWPGSSVRQGLGRKDHGTQLPPRLAPGTPAKAALQDRTSRAVPPPKFQEVDWQLGIDRASGVTDSPSNPTSRAPALSWRWQSTRKPSSTVSTAADLGPGASDFNWTCIPVCKKQCALHVLSRGEMRTK